MNSTRAAAVVLAAGMGTRFGETPKLIAPLDGKPLLQHVLDTLDQAGVAPIVVVLGHGSDEVRAAIAWRDETVVTNRNPQRGLLRSVLLGLRRLDETWSVPERTLVVLGDQPALRVDQIERLLAVDVDEERPFVVPRYPDGHPGNPVLLESGGRVLAEQFAIHSRKDLDRGLGPMFFRFPEHVRYVNVHGTNPDIDTPEDLTRVEQTAIVARGYDALGPDYLDWSSRVLDPARDRLTREFVDRLEPGARVLELGCGPGVPSTKLLAEKFAVTGVDLSRAQLDIARRNVPQATFIEADIASVDFAPETFDGVTAFYSLNHVPRDDHATVLTRIGKWLRRGGLLLATFPTHDDPAWTGEWLGQPMFFSGFDAATNRRLVTEAGFDMLTDEEVEVIEPEGPARFLWVLARKGSTRV